MLYLRSQELPILKPCIFNVRHNDSSFPDSPTVENKYQYQVYGFYIDLMWKGDEKTKLGLYDTARLLFPLYSFSLCVQNLYKNKKNKKIKIKKKETFCTASQHINNTTSYEQTPLYLNS